MKFFTLLWLLISINSAAEDDHHDHHHDHHHEEHEKKEKKSLDAHVHGVSTLKIVQDNNKSTTFIKDTFLESNLFSRFNRFSNALINYDYKTGHYVGN